MYQVFFLVVFVFLYLPVDKVQQTEWIFNGVIIIICFFSGRCIRIFRHPGRSLSTWQDVLAGLVLIFKFIFFSTIYF